MFFQGIFPLWFMAILLIVFRYGLLRYFRNKDFQIGLEWCKSTALTLINLMVNCFFCSGELYDWTPKKNRGTGKVVWRVCCFKITFFRKLETWWNAGIVGWRFQGVTRKKLRKHEPFLASIENFEWKNAAKISVNHLVVGGKLSLVVPLSQPR